MPHDWRKGLRALEPMVPLTATNPDQIGPSSLPKVQFSCFEQELLAPYSDRVPTRFLVENQDDLGGDSGGLGLKETRPFVDSLTET
jgi:hypothetical protein